MERRDAGLEQQADDQEGQAEHEQDVRAAAHGPGPDVAEPHAADGAVDQGQAVEEEGRRERAQQEVLDGRLLREQPPAAGQAADEVQRETEHLERDEHDEQVVGGDEQHHAADGERGQRVDLGLHPLGGEQLVVARAPGRDGGRRHERGARRVQRPLGEQQDGQRAQAGDRGLQEESRAVDGERATCRDLPAAGQQQGADQRAHRAHEGDGDLDRVPGVAGPEGLHENADAGRTEHEQQRRQRREGEVRGLDHQSVPPRSLMVAITAGSMRSSSGCG
jgi:hypothetical protein